MVDETPVPFSEAQRLAVLRSFAVLDTGPDADLDDLTRLVGRHFDVPIAFLTLVDQSRQWFKSRFGLDIAETPRALAFCAHTIMGARPLIILDAAHDSRFAGNPLVTGDPRIRFYAGAPLVTGAGFKLGTLCLIDRKPWAAFSGDQESDLVTFAGIAMRRLEALRSTERRDGLARERQAAQVAVEETVAHLAHEIRNPLTSVIGHAEIIEQQVLGPNAVDRYRESARQIIDTGRYLVDLAQRSLELVRLRSGEVEMREAWANLTEIDQTVRRLVAHDTAARGLAVSSTLADGDLQLYVDKLHIIQILTNLLSNAVKYTSPGGRIDIRAAEQDDGALILSVVDTGLGMTTDEVDRALRPFGRVHHGVRHAEDGFGLGLPLAKRLVELQGGRLSIDSAKGRGTTVSLRIPGYRVRRQTGDAPAVRPVDPIR